MSKYGPNVTKLIIKFIAREAVPSGGGLASGIEFLSNPERRKQVLESAEVKAIQAIRLIKSTPDNPFGDDDERIASELLNRIQERQLTKRAVDDCPQGGSHELAFMMDYGVEVQVCKKCGNRN